MKIIYFHGFGSSHASGTVQILQRELTEDEVIAPDIPVDPVEALPFLKELCEREQPDLIIGTSMGGMYAQQMRGFKRILVNPAFTMSTNSKVLKTGEYHFFNGRHDGAKTFKITKDIIQHHNQMERQQFKDITPEQKETCWCLIGLHDTSVTNAESLFKKNYLADHVIRFDGEHQLNDKVIKKVLIPLIEKLKN
ncbi:MAG: hypothetical protein II706_07770 [Bacteroidaceae bacterium]|jgi:hypothetical protein|nr:hypothetical protein [Bacteroidaceae bacterium]